MSIGKSIVEVVLRLKKTFNCKTFRIEYAVAAAALIITAIVSNKGAIEWIGVLAVFFTFCYVGITDRLHEREELRQKHYSPAEKKRIVECYYKLPWFYYAKEICRTIYFIYLGAWSALVGVAIFLLYGPWRKLYRKYHPLTD